MRYSCDPLGVGLLDLWRANDDETMYQLMASGYERIMDDKSLLWGG